MKIDSRWKWAAKDKDEVWFLYSEKPHLSNSVWMRSATGAHTNIPKGIITMLPCFWQDSLHQIIDSELIKYQEEAEPPAVTRAREILEECGIVDVQGTPADQLRPLVEVIELNRHLNEALRDKMVHLVQQGGPEPDAILTFTGDTLAVKFLYSGALPGGEEFKCYRVTK